MSEFLNNYSDSSIIQEIENGFMFVWVIYKH